MHGEKKTKVILLILLINVQRCVKGERVGNLVQENTSKELAANTAIARPGAAGPCSTHASSTTAASTWSVSGKEKRSTRKYYHSEGRLRDIHT